MARRDAENAKKDAMRDAELAKKDAEMQDIKAQMATMAKIINSMQQPSSGADPASTPTTASRGRGRGRGLNPTRGVKEVGAVAVADLTPR